MSDHAKLAEIEALLEAIPGGVWSWEEDRGKRWTLYVNRGEPIDPGAPLGICNRQHGYNILRGDEETFDANGEALRAFILGAAPALRDLLAEYRAASEALVAAGIPADMGTLAERIALLHRDADQQTELTNRLRAEKDALAADVARLSAVKSAEIAPVLERFREAFGADTPMAPSSKASGDAVPIEDVVMLIYTTVDAAMREGAEPVVRAMLRQLVGMPLTVMLAGLSASSPWAGRVREEREALMAAVREADPDRAAELLRGFEADHEAMDLLQAALDVGAPPRTNNEAVERRRHEEAVARYEALKASTGLDLASAGDAEGVAALVGLDAPKEPMHADLQTRLAGSSDPAARALAKLAANPALRAAFNAYPRLPPRIVVIDRKEQPNTRGKAMRELRRMGGKNLEEVAIALRISIPDVSSLERGEKTTDDAGWREYMTVLFALGGGMKAEALADPIGSGALARALAAPDDIEPAPAERCSTCGEPYTVPPTARSTLCSNGFHLCRDCTWSKGRRTKRCARHATPELEQAEIMAASRTRLPPPDDDEPAVGDLPPEAR